MGVLGWGGKSLLPILKKDIKGYLIEKMTSEEIQEEHPKQEMAVVIVLS